MLNDLTGKVFERLTVLEFSHLNEKKQSYWICECNCIDKTIKTIKGKYLISGDTKSCGCIRREHVLKLHKQSSKNSIRSISMSNKLPHKKELKNVWNNIKYRCNNPKDKHYEWYGGKGVKVCDEWLDLELGFFNFYTWAINNGYEKGLSIDRVEVNGNYEPSNCEWVTQEVQCNNMTTNVLIEIRNKTQTMAEWAREYNIPYDQFTSRYYSGVRGKALLEPIIETFSNTIINVDGTIHTSKEWAEIIGIDYKNFKIRYDKGDRGSKLIRPPANNKPIVTEINGELLKISQIGEKYNFTYGQIKERYKSGFRGNDLVKPLRGKIFEPIHI